MRLGSDLLKNLHQSSENRVDRVIAAAVPQRFQVAARRLQRAKRLQTFVIQRGDPIPAYSLGGGFKYSRSWSGGTLNEAIEKLKQRGSITISGVLQHRTLIGYGIAEPAYYGGTEITIIDVATTCRRSAGMSAELTIRGEQFSVGVGHLVVMQLIDVLPRPIRTDATHASSSYVFKSLGFAGIPGADNPGHLHLPSNNRH